MTRALVAPDGGVWQQDVEDGFHVEIAQAVAASPCIILVKRDRVLTERPLPLVELPEWADLAAPEDDREGRFRICVFRQGDRRLLLLDQNH